MLLLVDSVHCLSFVAGRNLSASVEGTQLAVRRLVHLVVDGAVARGCHRLRLVVARLLERLLELGRRSSLLGPALQIVDGVVVGAGC